MPRRRFFSVMRCCRSFSCKKAWRSRFIASSRVSVPEAGARPAGASSSHKHTKRKPKAKTRHTNLDSALRLASSILLDGGSSGKSTFMSASPSSLVFLSPASIFSIPSSSINRDSTTDCSTETRWTYVEVDAPLDNAPASSIRKSMLEN
jgi:hypothetical protein